MPRVLNKRMDKIPPDAIYVGRPSKWGNPYNMKDWKIAGFIQYTREEVIELYRRYLTYHPELVEACKTELKGKDLVCWCHTWDGKGDNPSFCHADILLELANQ